MLTPEASLIGRALGTAQVLKCSGEMGQLRVTRECLAPELRLPELLPTLWEEEGKSGVRLPVEL
jgi:hypothetical protein